MHSKYRWKTNLCTKSVSKNFRSARSKLLHTMVCWYKADVIWFNVYKIVFANVYHVVKMFWHNTKQDMITGWKLRWLGHVWWRQKFLSKESAGSSTDIKRSILPSHQDTLKFVQPEDAISVMLCSFYMWCVNLFAVITMVKNYDHGYRVRLLWLWL